MSNAFSYFFNSIFNIFCKNYSPNLLIKSNDFSIYVLGSHDSALDYKQNWQHNHTEKPETFTYLTAGLSDFV